MERIEEAPTYMPTRLSPEIINAAILGFEQQKSRIDDQIAELRATLPGHTEPADTSELARPKRRISASARRRMALGQQKRWAAIKGTTEPSHAATPEPLKPKRMLSAAGKAAIVAALKKRWAAKKAAAVKAAPSVAKKTTVRKAAPVKKSQKKTAKVPAAAAAATA